MYTHSCALEQPVGGTGVTEGSIDAIGASVSAVNTYLNGSACLKTSRGEGRTGQPTSPVVHLIATTALSAGRSVSTCGTITTTRRANVARVEVPVPTVRHA